MECTSVPTHGNIEAKHSQNVQEQMYMMEMQEKISHDNIMMQMLSNIMKSHDETMKVFAGNMK